MKLLLETLVLCILAGAGASGCAAETITNYAPGLRDDQLATILAGGVQVYSVDGVAVNKPKSLFSGTGKTVKVAPGEHDFAVGSYTQNGSYHWNIRYAVEPGHTYKLGMTLFNTGLKITDQQTMVQVVVGQ